MVAAQVSKKGEYFPYRIVPHTVEKTPSPPRYPDFLVGTDFGSQSLGLQVGKELSVFLPPFVLEGCPVSDDKT